MTALKICSGNLVYKLLLLSYTASQDLESHNKLINVKKADRIIVPGNWWLFSEYPEVTMEAAEDTSLLNTVWLKMYINQMEKVWWLINKLLNW